MDCSYLQSSVARILAFTVGAATHLLVFRVGEWDLWTVRIVLSLVLLQVAGVAVILKLPNADAVSIRAAAGIVGALGLSLVSGILSSMLVYRGFFHRLNRFPGPFLARFSNFYVTGLSAKNLHLYEEVHELHKQYGDVVRLGW